MMFTTLPCEHHYLILKKALQPLCLISGTESQQLSGTHHRVQNQGLSLKSGTVGTYAW